MDDYKSTTTFLIAEMTSIDGRVRYKTSLTDAGIARCEASHGHFCPLSFPLAAVPLVRPM
jgi:hypothetical protein